MPADPQRDLVRWIWAQPGAVPPAGLRAVGAAGLAAGLAAYREHAKALAVRALANAYPRLQAWLGEADFAGLAWAFARAHPPRQGDMNRWGATLAAFLSGQPGMEIEPPALARLDWALHALTWAPDPPAPDPGLWTLLQTRPADALRLRLLGEALLLPPGLQVQGAEVLSGRAEAEEGGTVWVWRRGWKPCWLRLPEDLAVLLPALQAAPHLAAAVEQALAARPALDLAAALHLAWTEGWLLAAEPL